jgi:hypothetical protein
MAMLNRKMDSRTACELSIVISSSDETQRLTMEYGQSACEHELFRYHSRP